MSDRRCVFIWVVALPFLVKFNVEKVTEKNKMFIEEQLLDSKTILISLWPYIC